MNPHLTYKQTNQRGRSRVELLLTLYDGAVAYVQRSLQASQAGDQLEATRLRLRAVKVVQGIYIGISPDLGEVPTNIARLCDYVQHCLLDTSVDRRRDAIKILSSIKGAFESIRDEGIRLEASGEIPSLEDCGMEVTA